MTLMKLFGANKKSKTNQLARNLEKIAKIAILRLDKEDYASAKEDLRWVEDNFIQLLRLKDNKFSAFKEIVDPGNKYKKVKFDSIDFDKIDFSNIKIVKLHEPLSESDRQYRKRYNSSNVDNGSDILSTYIEVVFLIYYKAGEKKQFAVQKQCTYVLANWIGVLDRFENQSPEIDFSLIIQNFAKGLTELNLSILQTKDEELHPLFRFLSFNIYLEKIFDEELNPLNGDLYFRFLFENVYLAIRLGKVQVFREFIERCIDSTYYPSSDIGAYSQLDALLVERLQTLGVQPSEISELLNRITEFGFVTVRYLRTDEEYDIWKASFREYMSEIESGNPFDAPIRQKILDIEKVAYRLLNFNKLQIVLINALTYSLFKGYDDVVKHSFDFNQPSDSRAVFANREIVPASLSEILNYLSFSFTLQNELLRYWEAHHGVEPYLEKIFLVFFYRYNSNRGYYVENSAQVVGDFCRIALRDDSSSVSALKSEIDDLAGVLQRQFENKTQFQRVHLPDGERYLKTQELLSSISAACQKRLDEIETTAEIRQSIKDKFLNACVSQYESSNYLYQFFSKYSRVEGNLENVPIVYDPGVNELLDRFAFIENWHVPYYGITSSIGNAIAERENSLGFSSIRRTATPDSNDGISEGDIPKIIRNSDVPRKIVIGRNIYFESIFRNERDFTPFSEIPDIIESADFFVGKFGDVDIYNVYDNVFDSKLLLIASAEDILLLKSKPVEGLAVVGSFGCRFVDFAYDEEQRRQFLEKPPQWLVNQVPDRAKQDDFLKTKVWIQISKGIYFEVDEIKKRGMLFEIH